MQFSNHNLHIFQKTMCRILQSLFSLNAFTRFRGLLANAAQPYFSRRLARRRRLSYFFTTTLPNDANPYNPRPLRPVSPHRPPPTSDKVDSAKNCLDESPDLTNNIQERVRTDIKTILSQERIPLRQFNLVFGK